MRRVPVHREVWGGTPESGQQRAISRVWKAFFSSLGYHITPGANSIPRFLKKTGPTQGKKLACRRNKLQSNPPTHHFGIALTNDVAVPLAVLKNPAAKHKVCPVRRVPLTS